MRSWIWFPASRNNTKILLDSAKNLGSSSQTPTCRVGRQSLWAVEQYLRCLLFLYLSSSVSTPVKTKRKGGRKRKEKKRKKTVAWNDVVMHPLSLSGNPNGKTKQTETSKKSQAQYDDLGGAMAASSWNVGSPPRIQVLQQTNELHQRTAGVPGKERNTTIWRLVILCG